MPRRRTGARRNAASPSAAGGSRSLGSFGHASLRTTAPVGVVITKTAQAFMSAHRWSNRSERRYAASTLSGITCASAASATARGKWVRSTAQSRNELRNPCAVMSVRPSRRSTMSSAMLESGLPWRRPGKTTGPPSAHGGLTGVGLLLCTKDSRSVRVQCDQSNTARQIDNVL